MPAGQIIPALLLTGPVGSGKSRVAAAIGRLLAAAEQSCAVIDLDWLGWANLREGAPGPDALIASNLAVVWPNFRAAGIEWAVMARALTSPMALDGIRRAVPGSRLTVVRLAAPPAVLASRLRRRDSGAELQEHLAAAEDMSRAMDDLQLEDWEVDTNRRRVAAVAAEVIRRAGWMGG